MKTVLHFVIALFLIYSATIQAQNAKDSVRVHSRVSGYSMNVGGGFTQFAPGSLDALNTRLQKNNYARVANQCSLWKLDLIHEIYKNTVFNLSVGGQMKKNTVNDSSKTTMSGFDLNLALGRVIYHSNKLLLYPMVGASFGSSDIHSHFTGLVSASDISGTNTYRAFDLSLNMDYLFNGTGGKIDWYSSKLNIHGTGVLSLSVGYTFCPANTYWNDNNYDISSRFNTNVNYPATVIGSVTASNFSMFYATVKFGFGAFSKR